MHPPQTNPNRVDDLRCLAGSLQTATGAESRLDAEIADIFGVSSADYTGSAEKSRRLCAEVLPAWNLRVGYDVRGVLPAATLSADRKRARAVAPTVPLAVLRALMDAALMEQGLGTTSERLD